MCNHGGAPSSNAVQAVPRLNFEALGSDQHHAWNQAALGVVEGWDQRGLLHDLKEEATAGRMDRHAIVGVRLCADPYECVCDVLPHLRETVSERLIPFTAIGGPFTMDRSFKGNRFDLDTLPWIAQVVNAYHLGMRRLYLLEHVSCKWAFLHATSVHDQVRSAISVMRMIEAQKWELSMPELEIGLLLQADFGPNHARTRQRSTWLIEESEFRPIVFPGLD